jgi:hypothetical protein
MQHVIVTKQTDCATHRRAAARRSVGDPLSEQKSLGQFLGQKVSASAQAGEWKCVAVCNMSRR